MLRDIYFYGRLEDRYGHHHRYNVDSPVELARCMQANYGDFYRQIRGGRFQFIRGDRFRGDFLGAEHLAMKLGAAPLHVVPVPEGAGGDSKPIITAVLGVALIAAAVLIPGAGQAALLAGSEGFKAAMAGGVVIPGLGCVTYGSIALLGATLALGGISQLLAPTPQVTDYGNREKEKTSWLFTGATNRTEQGGAIPLIYGGPIRVGSIQASFGIRVEDIREPDPPLDYHIISAGASIGGIIEPSGECPVMDGADYAFTATPFEGYFLSYWLVDNVEVTPSGDTYTFTDVTANHSIHAHFGPVS